MDSRTYHVSIKGSAAHGTTLQLQVGAGDPAAVICESVAKHVSTISEEWGPVDASQVLLTMRGVPLALSQPLPTQDMKDVVAHVVLEDGWRSIVYEWEDREYSDDDVAAWGMQLQEFVKVLSQRPLQVTGRAWGETGEFGEIVRLLDEMFHAEAASTSQPEPSTSGALLAVAKANEASSITHALEIVRQEQALQRKRCLQVVDVLSTATMNPCEILVPKQDSTVSSCVNKVAKVLPGVDPSQVQLSSGGIPLRHLDFPPGGELQALVSDDTWSDVVLRWRMDHPDCSEVNSFVCFIFNTLSKRPMSGTPDGTWSTSGEFGELIRFIDSLIRTEQKRGANGNDEELIEVMEVIQSAVDEDDVMASPASVQSKLMEEFGAV